MGELELNFPAEVTALVRHKQEGNQNLLWDPCRKKWLKATPQKNGFVSMHYPICIYAGIFF
jgi:hypothetical protein